MKNILIVFAAVLAVASFTGCKKKGGDSGAALAKTTEFKDKMCKCAEGDAECAKKVTDEMTKWAEAQPKAKEGATPAKPDPKMEEVSKQLGECMQKAMMPKMADPGSGAAPDPGSAAGSADPGSAAPAGSADGSAAAPAGSAEEKK